MQDVIHDSGVDLPLGGFQAGRDTERPLATGRTVVVRDGILKGATGSLVKTATANQCLVALSGQKGRIWAVVPAQLLREIKSV